MTTKPLNRKSYGSIGHLPGSRRGPADKGVNPGQARIATECARDKHDKIIVQVKLDGSNVAVAKVDGRVLALTRAGYEATTSKYEMHHLFAVYVRARYGLFDDLLNDNEWISGEWLAQAHGTRYDLTGREPFVAFDMQTIETGGRERYPYDEMMRRIGDYLTTAPTVHIGAPLSIADAMRLVDQCLYGELDRPEGAVWRVERNGGVDFLAKFVRPDKADGAYLPEVSGKPAIWHWRPEAICAD